MTALFVVMGAGAYVSLGILGWYANALVKKGDPEGPAPLLLWLVLWPFLAPLVAAGQLPRLNDRLERLLKPPTSTESESDRGQ